MDPLRDYSPQSYLSTQVKGLVACIDQREALPPPGLVQKSPIAIRPKRKFFQELLYSKELVEASPLTLQLSDKLLMARILEHYLGNRFAEFHPPVAGLKEFLEAHEFLTRQGSVSASATQLRKALARAFPQGFVLKPAFGWSSDGKTLYSRQEEVIAILAQGGGELYSPEELREPFRSPHASDLTSGERWMIMGRIEGTIGTAEEPSEASDSHEYRVHTFQDQVVPGGTRTRWNTDNDSAKIERLDRFVQELLDLLPKNLTMRQAWGLDLFISPDDQPTLIEINTNRGQSGGWSGFLRIPEVIAAYVRHLETRYAWRFSGPSGTMLRSGLANVPRYLRYELQACLLDYRDPSRDRNLILARLKTFSTRFYDPLIPLMNVPALSIDPDFQEVRQMMEVYQSVTAPVARVGDAAWRNFLSWAEVAAPDQ